MREVQLLFETKNQWKDENDHNCPEEVGGDIPNNGFAHFN
jgi:hypothetical protein